MKVDLMKVDLMKSWSCKNWSHGSWSCESWSCVSHNRSGLIYTPDSVVMPEHWIRALTQYIMMIKGSAVEHLPVHWITGCCALNAFLASLTSAAVPDCIHFSCCSLIVSGSAARWAECILTTQTTVLRSHVHKKKEERLIVQGHLRSIPTFL